MAFQGLWFAIKKHIDKSSRWLTPFLNFVIIVFSLLPSYNASSLIQQFPSFIAPLVFLSKYAIVIVAVSAVLNMILSIFDSVFVRDTIKELQGNLLVERKKNEIIANNIKALFDGFLFHLSTGKLEFAGQESRATLYIHDGVNKFIPFGRYSTNPQYSRPGRSEYPDDQGVIARGWQKGWYFDSNKSADDYVLYNNREYGMPTGVLRKVKMKSKLFGVKRIENLQGQPIALMLVESTHADQFVEADLKLKLAQEERVIAELITQLKEYIPLPLNAKERGL